MDFGGTFLGLIRHLAGRKDLIHVKLRPFPPSEITAGAISGRCGDQVRIKNGDRLWILMISRHDGTNLKPDDDVPDNADK
jgi:hypothetical protein